MKLAYTLCMVVLLLVTGCTPKKYEDPYIQEKVTNLVKRWIVLINNNEDLKLKRLYANPDIIPPVFKEFYNVFFVGKNIRVMEDADSNFVATFDFELSAPNGSLLVNGSQTLVFQADTSRTYFKIMKASNDVELAMIKALDMMKPPPPLKEQPLAFANIAIMCRSTEVNIANPRALSRLSERKYAELPF